MPEPLRVGVIGANSFVARAAIYPAVAASTAIDIVAAASNSGPPAEVSAISRASYQAVLDDPGVEAVYIPLPNDMHREWTIRAAAAGKHVLCEKPLATAPDDVAAMYAACREAGVLLAEAFMTPFHPRSEAVTRAVRGTAIGEVRSIRSEFTFTIGPEHGENYRWKRAHGGGALWDVGIYTLSPILDVLDRPSVSGVSSTQRSEVDATTAVSFTTDTATGTALCSFEMPERQLLEVRGTEGTIALDRAFTPTVTDDSYTIHRLDGSQDRIVTGGADPYQLMLEAFAAACRGERAWPRSQGDTLAVISQIAMILSMQSAGSAPSRPTG